MILTISFIYSDETRTIPSGTNVVIMPYALHKDPDYFQDPKEFQPERFLAENCHNRHPFAYIPFSLGPRNCIGQKFGMNEAKVILSYLLRSYTFTTTDTRESIKLDLDLVIRPMNGLSFKITKRWTWPQCAKYLKRLHFYINFLNLIRNIFSNYFVIFI